jgi:Ring hydroxylating beta subunit
MSIIMAVSFIRSPGSLTPRRLAAKDVRSRDDGSRTRYPGINKVECWLSIRGSWAEDPPSRTRHLIGNLEAAPLENWEAEAKTRFLGVPLAPGDGSSARGR